MMKQYKDRYNPYKIWTVQDSPACMAKRDSHSRFNYAEDTTCPRLHGKGLCVTSNVSMYCHYAAELDEAKHYMDKEVDNDSID